MHSHGVGGNGRKCDDGVLSPSRIEDLRAFCFREDPSVLERILLFPPDFLMAFKTRAYEERQRKLSFLREGADQKHQVYYLREDGGA